MARAPRTSELLQQALGLYRTGNLVEADRVFDKVLARDPRNADALNLKGVIAHEHGRNADALLLFARAIEILPRFPSFHFNRGLAFAALGRHAEALKGYAEAAALDPNFADPHLHTGLVLQNMNRPEDAIDAFRKMTRAFPNDPRGHYNLGVCIEKVYAFLKPITQPEMAGEAVAAFERALALNPGDSQTHLAYSNLMARLGEIERAIGHMRTAVAFRPNWSEGWSNLGSHLEATGDRGGAIAAYDRALRLDPDNTGAIVNRGITYLAMGRLAEGWEGYARRFEDPRFPFFERAWPWPSWAGQPASDKKVFIWSDQGIGDQILYASMIPELVKEGARCVLECAPKLVSLFRRSLAGVEVVPRDPSSTAAILRRRFDYQCSILDLGRWLRRSLGTFPNARGVLKCDDDRARAIRQRYLNTAPAAKLVGISWRTLNPNLRRDKSKSLAAFLPVFAAQGYRFISLQFDACMDDVKHEVESFSGEHGVQLYFDPAVDTFSDLEAAAAQIAALDMVITVSNSSAHLAGALNVPTYIHVPNGQKRLWYWLTEGEFSPWYRSVRICRKPHVDDLLEYLPCA